MALTKPNTNQVEKHPDAKKHKYMSFAKSVIRIAAFGFLVNGDGIFKRCSRAISGVAWV